MNTRIQVEHPVTELVTGIDLVDWQLRVASGEALPFRQDDITLDGHAIECRITSEDPEPRLPALDGPDHATCPDSRPGPASAGTAGVLEGIEVTLHYDPLLAKLIVHGSDRTHAIDRMARALDELVVAGVDTCAAVPSPGDGRAVDFRAGDLTIRYLEEHPELLEPEESEEILRAAAVAAALLEHEDRARHRSPRIARPSDTGMSAWRSAGAPWSR